MATQNNGGIRRLREDEREEFRKTAITVQGRIVPPQKQQKKGEYFSADIDGKTPLHETPKREKPKKVGTIIDADKQNPEVDSSILGRATRADQKEASRQDGSIKGRARFPTCGKS